jgi:hypothetical protein
MIVGASQRCSRAEIVGSRGGEGEEGWGSIKEVVKS